MSGSYPLGRTLCYLHLVIISLYFFVDHIPVLFAPSQPGPSAPNFMIQIHFTVFCTSHSVSSPDLHPSLILGGYLLLLLFLSWGMNNLPFPTQPNPESYFYVDPGVPAKLSLPLEWNMSVTSTWNHKVPGPPLGCLLQVCGYQGTEGKGPYSRGLTSE